jgi:hypothetical protein
MSVAHGVCQRKALMTMGDFIASLAANFIVAGIVWQLKGANAGLICLTIGFILLIAAYFFRKKPSPQTPPSQQNTQTVKQEVNFGDEFLKQLKEHAKPIQFPKLESPPKPELNIKFLGIRSIKVDFVNNVPLQLCSFHERTDGKIGSVVACFRNEAIFGKTIKPIYDARAQLKLFDNTGAEIGHGLSRAAWLEHATDLVDLIPGGDVQCVIFLLQDAGTLTVPSKGRKSSGGGDIVSDKFLNLAQPPVAIELSLLDSDNQLVMPPMLSELTGEGGTISYRIKR